MGGPRNARGGLASGYCQEPEAADTSTVIRAGVDAYEEIPDVRSGIRHEEFQA